MSVLDRQVLFSDSQAVTASAVSTDVVDLGSSRDIGAGAPVDVVLQVTETFTAAGGATLTGALQTASDEAFSSPLTLTSTGALALADLTVGRKISISSVPRGTLRFLRLAYTVATGPMTAGRVTAGVGTAGAHQDVSIYPDAL
jgi:hypothetical protein